MTYFFENDEVYISEHNFGYIITLDKESPLCPSVRPRSSDIVVVGNRTFKVDCPTNFCDSYDMLCYEVKKNDN